jgi:O-antigen ligase
VSGASATSGDRVFWWAPDLAPVHRARLERWSDWLAILTAVSLPWSRFTTGLLAILWFITVAPTIDPAELRRELARPACLIPVLLVGFAVLGMAWSKAPWSEQLHGLGRFAKLLAIPVLMIQFRRSARGEWVFLGFLASCVVMLLLAFIVGAYPHLAWSETAIGLPVKNAIIQSQEFVFCAFALLGFAVAAAARGRYRQAGGLAALAALFLVCVLFVAVSRTALATLPVLVLVFAFRFFDWRGVLGAIVAGLVVGAIAFGISPYLRERATGPVFEIEEARTGDTITSSGERLEYWRKSLGFIAERPLLGHGTGAIRPLFDAATAGETGVRGLSTVNPHNQTLAVAIQLGLFGAGVLWAMWLSHAWFFRGPGVAAWIGLVLVSQNVVSSLFNSHLFDFFEGWLYVIGVGVAGGVLLREAGTHSVKTT